MKLRNIVFSLIFGLFISSGYAGVKIDDDILYNGFFYSKTGTLVFQIPDLPDSKWTKAGPVTENGITRLKLILGTAEAYEGLIVMVGFTGQKKEVDTEQAVAGLVKELLSGSPYLKAASDISGLSMNGGKGHQILLAGKTPKGVNETAAVIVMANGSAAAALIVRGNSQAMEKQLLPAAKDILESVRLDKTVPALPNANPGTSLEGVWIGPYMVSGDSGYQKWLIFDKNGYVSKTAPYNTLYLYPQALYQYKPNQVGTYQVSGNQLKIKWISDGKSETFPFKKSGSSITVNKDEYKLVSGKGDGVLMNGKYEAFSFSSYSPAWSDCFSVATSSAYWFDKKGNFKASSYVSSTYVDKNMLNENIAYVDAMAKSKSQKGKYKIKGNLLILSYDNGMIQKLTFYPFLDKSGNVKPDIVYISGDNFLLDN